MIQDSEDDGEQFGEGKEKGKGQGIGIGMGKGKGEGKGKSTNVASEKYENRNLPTMEKMAPDSQDDDEEKRKRMDVAYETFHQIDAKLSITICYTFLKPCKGDQINLKPEIS